MMCPSADRRLDFLPSFPQGLIRAILSPSSIFIGHFFISETVSRVSWYLMVFFFLLN